LSEKEDSNLVLAREMLRICYDIRHELEGEIIKSCVPIVLYIERPKEKELAS
jgi:hypothetical protein